MKQYIMGALGALLIGFGALIFYSLACAGTLLLWPTIPDKPVINLKVVDAKTAVVTEREMTEEEILKAATYDARKSNFTTVQTSIKGALTGKYEHVISHKGPVWSKDGVNYSIAYIANQKRIKCEIKPSGACQVIDTGEVSGAEWLRKNGYKTTNSVVVEKENVVVNK